MIKDRIDSEFMYVKFLYKLNRDFESIKNIANVVNDQKNLKKYPNEEFIYIQLGNIDSKFGTITSFERILGKNAPDRAKRLVSTGDVICANLKGSIENIAIIPKSFNNAIVSTGFTVFRPKAPMTSECLYVLLRQTSNLFQTKGKTKGTIMPSISQDDYKENLIPKLNKQTIESITIKVKKIQDYMESIRTDLVKVISES